MADVPFYHRFFGWMLPGMLETLWQWFLETQTRSWRRPPPKKLSFRSLRCTPRLLPFTQWRYLRIFGWGSLVHKKKKKVLKNHHNWSTSLQSGCRGTPSWVGDWSPNFFGTFFGHFFRLLWFSSLLVAKHPIRDRAPETIYEGPGLPFAKFWSPAWSQYQHPSLLLGCDIPDQREPALTHWNRKVCIINDETPPGRPDPIQRSRLEYLGWDLFIVSMFLDLTFPKFIALKR